MRILLNKRRSLNKSIEFVISCLCCSFLIISIYKPESIATIIQGDVGGWIENPPTEILNTNTAQDNTIPSLPIRKNQNNISKKKGLISKKVSERISQTARKYGKQKLMCSNKPESCARCVRVILKEAGCNYKMVSSNPLDGWKEPYNMYYANSLWGRDIGLVKGKNEKVVPGDLVFFENTYKGNWWNKSGLIPKDNFNNGKESYTPVVTHVEIAISSTQMVGKRNALKPMSVSNIRTRFGNKFLGSVTLYAEFCNSNT